MVFRLALIAACVSAAGLACAADFVAQRTLRPGTIIVAGDLLPVGDIAGGTPDRAIGLEVRRAIYAGRLVMWDNLGPPTLVRRNDVVTMIYRSGALGLRTEGRSLGAGGVGERIEVMNLDSRLTVRATIVGRRRVEVSR